MTKRVQAVLCFLLVVSIPLIAGDGKKYGKELTVKEKTSIGTILKNPSEYDGKRVLIEGDINEVCQSMGCWIKISDSSTEEPMLFKVEDGVIEFPKDAKGKKVKAEGVVSVKTYTKEELLNQAKHEAEEQGKEFDASKITGPKVVIRVNGEGAVIAD